MARRPMAESTPWALQPSFLRHSPFSLRLRPWLPYAFAALLLVALQRRDVVALAAGPPEEHRAVEARAGEEDAAAAQQ